MTSFYSLFSKSFGFFSRHRIVLYAAILTIAVLSGIILKSIKLSEDLQSMMPTGKSDAALDISLLQQAPFMQKVVINLKAEPQVNQNSLTEAADQLAKALKKPYYDRVISGPQMASPESFFPWLLAAAPALMTEKDQQEFKAGLNSQGILAKLENIRSRLNSPEGWVIKGLLQSDPLDFHRIALDKFRFLNMFKGMVLKGGHFISADGRNALLVADTPLKVTDSQGSKDLVLYTQGIIDRLNPPGIKVSFLSGHAYTYGNAETVKADLYIILSCASLTILVLLFLFMQNWRAVFVFLVPTSVVLIATAGVLAVYQTISAITIAFGSVLMGIADDYPIFTYFSLRNQEGYSGETVADISRPVLFSGVTTMATFSALFFSDLSGQRQIAFFSIVGIIASLAFSLLVLPHFIRGLRPARFSIKTGVPARARGRTYRVFIIGGWLLLLALGLWQGSRVIFNGDMRSVNWVSKTLMETEKNFKDTWGDFRDTAMVFSEGRDLESALIQNDRLFSYLKRRIPAEGIISLAPLFPSKATQEENIRRWETLWDKDTQDRVRALFIREGDKAGFQPQAFAPFFERWSIKANRVSLDDLKKAGFGELINSLVIFGGDSTRVLTLVPDTPQVAALFNKNIKLPFAARFVSQSGFNQTISRAMVKNFIQYIITASLVILVFLVLLFRQAGKVLCAMIPVITGLLFMFGVMGWKGIEFNLFNIIATILVIGLSVDLGIFMVSRISEGKETNTGQAVLLGGLTSLVGMGALTLAHHPALYSIGITVLLGMCGAIPSALLVIPAFFNSKKGQKKWIT
ncbi:MAG: MMPL family transporter [Thermodesulfobacteriota bacterium]|jgi:predicted exporter